MERKTTMPQATLPASMETPPSQVSEVDTLLSRVKDHLNRGEITSALELIRRGKIKSPWLTNAAGVCQLRLGKAEQAVTVFRDLALAPGGLLLRADAPTVFKTNYATALMAAGNLSGAIRVLDEIGNDKNASVGRLRAAILAWKQSLSFLQKVGWYLGYELAQPVRMDFALGDLG